VVAERSPTKGGGAGAGREALPAVDEPREGATVACGGGHGQTGRERRGRPRGCDLA